MSLLALGDIVVVPVAIGLALGRLGNFINQELYGTVTTLPWGMAFPGAEGLRHPIQFYEMITDLVTAWVCYWSLRATSGAASKSARSTGNTAALFLIFYSIARFSIEFVRDQAMYPLTDISGIAFTRGQLLTIPMFLVGVGICLWSRWRHH